jgi:glycosyltransferase involved in cell wall biosynthesis
VRLALVNSWPEKTGIGTYTFNLARELQNLVDFEHLFFNKGQHITADHNLRNLKAFNFFHIQAKRFINDLFFYSLIFPRDLNVDLCHFSCPQISHLASKTKQPSVVTCHDAAMFALKSISPVHAYYNRILRKRVKNLSKMQKIIAVSNYAKDDLMKYCGFDENLIAVTHLGFDQHVFKPGSKEKAREKLNLPLDKKIFLHVGFEDDRKNVKTIIQALKEINDPDVLFLRAGHQHPKIKNLIDKLNLTQVKHVGSVSHQKLGEFYQAADAFVFPSTYEGFGLPPLEAMASGCPVITTNVCSLPEVTGKAAISLDPFDTAGWAENIEKVLNSKILQKKLRARGLEQSRKFSWKKCAQETVKIYNEVLK